MLKNRNVVVALSAMLIAFSGLSADSVKPNHCKGPDLCPSYTVDTCYGWAFDVGLIYENIRIDNDGIAIESSIGGGTFVSPGHLENFINYDFDFQPGLRLGAAYFYQEDMWRVQADFEWLAHTANYHATLTAPTFYRPASQAFVVYVPANDSSCEFGEVTASLSVDYFLLDVYLARGSYMSKKMAFEPFLGLKSAWITYNMSNEFSNDISGASPTPMPASTSWQHTAKAYFWGIGPELGMCSTYDVYADWSIFATGNASVLFGQTSLIDRAGFVTALLAPGDSRVNNNLNLVCPTMRGILGIQYDRDFFCESQHGKLRLGFDGRYYFNQYPTVEQLGGFVANDDVDGISGATGSLVSGGLITTPYMRRNGMGMIGLILDLSWDF